MTVKVGDGANCLCATDSFYIKTLSKDGATALATADLMINRTTCDVERERKSLIAQFSGDGMKYALKEKGDGFVYTAENQVHSSRNFLAGSVRPGTASCYSSSLAIFNMADTSPDDVRSLVKFFTDKLEEAFEKLP